MELKELVTVIVDLPEDHSEKTCPWHNKTPGKSKALDCADTEEDALAIRQGVFDLENSSGTLGDNLTPKPKRFEVHLKYREAKKKKIVKIGSEDKEITEYEEDSTENAYYASYSAHHIIPGNDALKQHPVLRWVGHQSKLGKYGEGIQSELAEGEFIGYDVNGGANGVWLPGPYPLSRTGKWTNKDYASATAVSFKRAYAFAVMDVAKRQFHFHHDQYSDKVKLLLAKIDARLESYAPACQKDKRGKPAKPYKAPHGLVAKLNRISDRMRPLLDGRRWHPEIYTDNDAGPAYLATANSRNLRKATKSDWKKGFKP